MSSTPEPTDPSRDCTDDAAAAAGGRTTGKDATSAGAGAPSADTAARSAQTGVRPAGTGRLTGIDVARALALFGMMATHVLSGAASEQGVGEAVHQVVGGRAAALFAVLAGTGLALAGGGHRPDPLRISRLRRTTAVRAVCLLGIGLTLGLLDTPVAIILAYYGLLFLCAIAFLGLGFRAAATGAAGCAVLAPVLSYWLRGGLGLEERPGSNLSWSSLGDPVQVGRHLLLTGYYPVLTWTAYLFAGLALGRLALRDGRVCAAVAATGAGLAAGAWLLSVWAVRAAGGFDHLVTSDLLSRYTHDGRTPNDSFYCTGPVNDPWWLLVRVAHSGSITDLVHTIGTSLLVIGLTLLCVRALQRSAARVGVRMLAAAGSMTLTLYCLHAVAVGFNAGAGSGLIVPAWPYLVLNVVGAVILALLWGAPERRGPIEELIASTARAASSRA